jgi:RNA ligase (TIGR02306 family)
MANVNVTVEKVRAVEHHPNADKLDLATIRGWQVIVGRDQYKKGDPCVYVPIDSVLPVELAHEWGVAKYMRGNMRVRTIKLRGSVSQGLVVPMENLPEYLATSPPGADLTKDLGITKWVPTGKPAKGMRLQHGQSMNPRRSTPWFPRYTKIDHLGNNPDAFISTDWVVVKEKRHGTNFRMGFVKKARKSLTESVLELAHKVLRRLGLTHDAYIASGHYLHVGSHNVIRERHKDDLYWKAAQKVLDKSKTPLPPGYVFFFEISGPEVQKGFDYGAEPGDFIVECIDIFCTRTESYLGPVEVEHKCYHWDIPQVPAFCQGRWAYVKSMLDHYASGPATGDGDHIREGIVIKAYGGDRRKIYKLISPDYLIKQHKKKPEDETEWK